MKYLILIYIASVLALSGYMQVNAEDQNQEATITTDSK